jgi:hypothetical protein
MLKNLGTRTKWAGLILPVVVVTALSFFSLINVVVSVAAASEQGDWLYELQQPALQLQQRLSLGQELQAAESAPTVESGFASGVNLALPTWTPTATATTMPTNTPTTTPTSEPTATPTTEPTATLMPTSTPLPVLPTAVVLPPANDDDYDNDDLNNDDDDDDEDDDDDDDEDDEDDDDDDDEDDD